MATLYLREVGKRGKANGYTVFAGSREREKADGYIVSAGSRERGKADGYIVSAGSWERRMLMLSSLPLSFSSALQPMRCCLPSPPQLNLSAKTFATHPEVCFLGDF